MKNAKIIAVSSLMCLLTGCSQLQDRIDKEVLDRTYICDEHNEEYARYLENDKLYQANREEYDDILNADTPNDEEAVAAMGGEIIPGGILISFGQNSFMNTRFYKLSGTVKEPVEGGSCYMTPGSSIYAETPEIINFNENYRFKEYRVHTENDTEMKFVPSEDGYILEIPDDITVEKISVLPVGEYRDREIKCTLFRIDDKGSRASVSDASGNWNINGGHCEKETNDSETILRFASTFNYSVNFTFDDDNYYVDTDKTSPSNFTEKDSEIVFDEIPADMTPQDYNVFMRKYSVITFSGDYLKPVISKKVNGDKCDFFDEKNHFIGKLKIGDVFTFDVREGYTAACSSTSVMEEELATGTRYSFTVDKENMSVSIVKGDGVDPVTPITFEHVEIKLFTDDEQNPTEIGSGSSVADNTTVRVEITPAPGYTIIGKNVSDGVYTAKMKYSDYKNSKKIQNILDGQLKKYYSIDLPEGDEHGTFTYTLDGKVIPAGKCKYYEGQELAAEFTVTNTSKYKIVRGEINIFGITSITLGDDTSGDGSKELTAEDSNKTVNPDFFGIQVIAR